MNTQTPEQIQNKPFFYKPFFIPPKNTIFADRAIRFDELAQQEASSWQHYLTLLAQLSRAQQSALAQIVPNSKLPEKNGDTELPTADGAYIPEQMLLALQIIVNEIKDTLQPDIQAALSDLLAKTQPEMAALAQRVLRDEVGETEKIYQIWLHAAMQVVWTAWATQLTDDVVAEREERSFCPCCGSDAIASMVYQSGDWDGLRYQHCALCNSRWNALRAKCTFCNDQSAISHQKIDSDTPAVFKGARAEHCGKCSHYRKLFLLAEQQYADPIADDLASLALDILMADSDQGMRGGYNPFLLS